MHRLQKAGIQAASRTKLLLTAAEAYPALEGAFLDARHDIRLSFRIFDLTTKLRSKRGREVGKTWFDLILHVLRRGVAVRIDITDFDPCARPELHRGTWRTMRMLAAVRELAGAQARLSTRALMHPAQSGFFVRLAFWPMAMRKLGKHAQWLNDQPAAQRETILRDMPGLAPYLSGNATHGFKKRVLSLPRLFPAIHHQKIALFDEKWLYIGGLNLNDRRYDTPKHARKGSQTWHDVQLLMSGPVTREARLHLDSFHEVAAGQQDAAPPRRLLRTISCRRRFAPFAIGPSQKNREIATAHEMLTARAQKLIYLETQYFRSLSLARHLAKAAKERPDLNLILIVPAAPEEMAFSNGISTDLRYGEYLQARAIGIVQQAFGARAFVGNPAQPRQKGNTGPDHRRDRVKGAPLIYLHAKVSIFDDESAIVSSANLNGRSLAWDTEAGVYLRRSDGVAAMRGRVMRHWLPDDADPCCFELDNAAAHWAKIAQQNAALPPGDRDGFLMPYDPDAGRRVGRRLPFVPEEMV
ncbi:phospholipase D-like domain-containing protein [Thioclava sp.]|uniref:phospholipase D-like domain-containing protein n=1 Tax=Thioclava sp. TaxID=1933450 RepID=UPI003AA9202D